MLQCLNSVLNSNFDNLVIDNLTFVVSLPETESKTKVPTVHLVSVRTRWVPLFPTNRKVIP